MIHPWKHVASVWFLKSDVSSFFKLLLHNILDKIIPHLIVVPVSWMQLTKDLVSLRVIHQLPVQNFVVQIGKLFDKSQLTKRQVFYRLNRKIEVFFS